ncbi:MAG: NTP transferase domain-containing protein [Anaerolineaceae bacterium]|nr:MAG: NTP transferase domain-containing protein [Anaerolineaceae bacterium]
MDIWVLIPVKSLFKSKNRLAHLLTAEQRAQLIRGLLKQELAVLNQIPAITQVLVISSDPTVWALARQYGAQVEEEPGSQGLNIAVRRGMVVAAANGASGALLLPVDLPFITASDVMLLLNAGLDMPIVNAQADKLLTSAGDNGSQCSKSNISVMAICGDEEGEGTNALFLDPKTIFTFHYGPGSFQRHVQEANRRGLTVRIVHAPGLQFDLDNEKDWLIYQASTVNC